MSSDLISLPPARMSPAAPAARPAPGRDSPQVTASLRGGSESPRASGTGKGKGTARRGTPSSAGEPAAVRAAAGTETELPPAPRPSPPEPPASPRGKFPEPPPALTITEARAGSAGVPRRPRSRSAPAPARAPRRPRAPTWPPPPGSHFLSHRSCPSPGSRIPRISCRRGQLFILFLPLPSPPGGCGPGPAVPDKRRMSVPVTAEPGSQPSRWGQRSQQLPLSVREH